MRNNNIEIIGWVGVICIVSAFALNTLQILSAESWFYLILNIVGSIAIIIEALTKKDYQPVVLNIVWAVIAAIGLLRALL